MRRGRVALRRGAAALLFPAVAAFAQTLDLSVGGLDIPAEARRETAAAAAAGDWRTAEAALHRIVQERAAQAKPEDAALLRALAVAHFQAGRWFAAARAFKRSDRIEPLRASDRFALATAFSRFERRHWARAELERLVAEHPAEKDYRFALSEIFYFYQWFGQAAEQLDEVIRLAPDFAPAHDRLGQCFEGMGEHEKAAAAYRRALALDEASGRKSPWPAFHLGGLLHDLGRLAEAEAALERAAAADARQAAVHYELGVARRKLGKWAAAAASLEQAAALEPENAKTLPALAQVYRRMGREDAARQTLERFRDLRARSGRQRRTDETGAPGRERP